VMARISSSEPRRRGHRVGPVLVSTKVSSPLRLLRGLRLGGCGFAWSGSLHWDPLSGTPIRRTR